MTNNHEIHEADPQSERVLFIEHSGAAVGFIPVSPEEQIWSTMVWGAAEVDQSTIQEQGDK